MSDVFTREVRAKAVTDKLPETVSGVMQDLIPTLVGDKTDFASTTDAVREFSRLEEGERYQCAGPRNADGQTGQCGNRRRW